MSVLRNFAPLRSTQRSDPMRLLVSAALVGVLVLTGCSNRALLEKEDELAALRAELADVRAQNDELRAQNASMDRQLREAMDRVATGLHGGGPGETVAVLQADDLFAPATATLTAAGAARLDEVAATLRHAYPGRALRIEGHSDDRPVGGALAQRYPSNWELSAARAAAVGRHLQRAHGFGGEAIEIVGLAEHHPAASNATAEGRAQNRRVRIAVTGR